MISAISFFDEEGFLVPSQNDLLGLSRIAIGTMQLAVGIFILPLQATGRIFKNNQQYLLSKAIPKYATITQIVKASLVGAFGIVVLPFQLCGRIFKYKQPFLIALGISNIQKGFRQSGIFLGNVLLLI